MRISQLARSLGIPPSDVVEFLGNQKADANSRLDKEVVEKIINHFAPEKLSDILQVRSEVQTPSEVQAPSEEPEVKPIPEEIITEPPISEEQLPEVPVEVIRVSKVELQGLRVLGKIDLPEPKKKGEPTPGEEQEEPQGNQQPK